MLFSGSEVTEVVSLMIQLNKMNVEFQCFAPNQNQMHVINHINGETSTETRNVLVESARLARGEVKDIAELNCNDFQAVLLPGGFGAAKNLSDYAVKGASFDVHEQVKRVITVIIFALIFLIKVLQINRNSTLLKNRLVQCVSAHYSQRRCQKENPLK